MRILVAVDAFEGSLTSRQAAAAIAAGWRTAAPRDDVVQLPLGDTGAGFVDIVARALPTAETLVATVSDPLGRQVPSAVVFDESDGRRTAYLEASTACGAHLLDEGERNPAITSSYGVGELLEEARVAGASRIVVGLGTSVTHDGGAGLLAALGVGSPERLGRGGGALDTITALDLAGLDEVRRRWRGIDIVVATDLDSPLLGLQGASALYAERSGATPAAAAHLESCLGHYASIVRRAAPSAPDLLTGLERRADREPGAGAAGGIGFALYVLGARWRSGVDLLTSVVRLDEQVGESDLVVTGEGRFDWQSLRGTVVSAVATSALTVGVPSIVIAGQVLVGRREAMTLGVSGCYAVADNPQDVLLALADPIASLQARAERVARTWSPRSYPG